MLLLCRSKSSDCLTLSKSLTSINLRSSQGAELDIDESIFCRCTPQTHKPPSPSPPVDSPVSRRADMNKYPSGEDDVDIIQQVMNSPKMKNISSPKPSLLRTPVRGASRQSVSSFLNTDSHNRPGRAGWVRRLWFNLNMFNLNMFI